MDAYANGRHCSGQLIDFTVFFILRVIHVHVRQMPSLCRTMMKDSIISIYTHSDYSSELVIYYLGAYIHVTYGISAS